MTLVGKAIGTLASAIGGQLLLELPDELSVEHVSRLVASINDACPADPPFCLFVHDQRGDLEPIEGAVDFRELAMFRQGSHLAVVYAGENRGMATYTSVYAMLLGPGFPGTDAFEAGAGLVGLDDIASSVVPHLGELGDNAGDVSNAITSVARFLADVYQLAGNGQSSIAADWWLHFDTFLAAVEGLGGLDHEDVVRSIYGCASLPFPSEGTALKLKPRDYHVTLSERWSDAASIDKELLRLQDIPTSHDGASLLRGIDWEKTFERWSLRTDSLITKISQGGFTTGGGDARVRGWGGISETDFQESYRDAKNKLTIEENDAPLPRPWSDGIPVLLLGAPGENDPDTLQVQAVTLIVPWKGGPEHVDIELAALRAAITVNDKKGVIAAFDLQEVAARPSGLALRGELSITLNAKSPWQTSIEVLATGAICEWIADRSDCTVALLRPGDALLQARRTAKGGSGPRKAHAMRRAGETDPQIVKLGSAGEHEIGIAVLPAPPAIGITGDVLHFQAGWGGDGGYGALWHGQGLLTSDAEVEAGEDLFTIRVAVESGSPLSPVVAAAEGTSPDCTRFLESSVLGELDGEMTSTLAALDDGEALGSFLRGTSPRYSSEPSNAGVSLDRELTGSAESLFPGLPSAALLSDPAYARLRAAYMALGIPAQIAAIEESQTASGVTVSRISMEFISTERIDELLSAYEALVDASGTMTPSDQFWARHPFSVAIYPDTAGTKSIESVLLSPLHPLRLAWLRDLQVGLRAAFDDGSDARQSLSLVDGTVFPALDLFEDEFNQPVSLLPMALDTSPGEVFVGWQAFVMIEGNKPVPSKRVNGKLFPIDGISGLSSAAVSAAIDDFLRVSPHVQSLRVELAAVNEARRSTSIDTGLVAKIAQLAEGSHSLDGVRGVRVVDSNMRLGPNPSFRAIGETLDRTRGRFNAEWTGHARGESRAHVTFLEGLAATLALVPDQSSASGWIPRVPLRRFPARSLQPKGNALRYSLGSGSDDRPLAKALRAFERLHGKHYELRVKPNLAALPQKPNWMVSGDFGVDPQAIALASRQQAGDDYMLWDWRPVSTTSSKDVETGRRSQPYFIMAQLPPSLSNAIKHRIDLLSPGIEAEAASARAKRLVTALSTRAVGLNTLLAVGHHQATGALGFYFALISLEKWMEGSTDEDLRFVIPVDAVDPFLREIPASAPASRRRADLLAVRADLSGSGPPVVTLVAIEIKHYGMAKAEENGQFPKSGDASLDDHVDQLETYQRQLVDLCETYANSTGARASVIGQQLATVLEAALQLSPQGGGEQGLVLLQKVAEGTAEMKLGKGLLMWFQAGASGSDGSKAEIEEFYGPLEKRRIDVRIDPREFDKHYWAHDPDAGRSDADHAVARALALATVEGDEAPSKATPAPPPPRSASKLPDDTVGTSRDGESTASSGKDGPESSEIPSMDAPSTDAVGRVSHSAGSKRMVKERLEATYRRLLEALGEFGVQVQRPKNTELYREGPAFIEFAVYPAYGVSVSKIQAQLENVKLRLGLPSDANIGCTNHLGNVLLTVPKNDEDRYFVSTSELWAKWARPAKGFHVPLGEDISGNVVSLDLSSPNSPHLLIAGVTGSGKSEALLTLLRGATWAYPPEELQLAMIDPKRTELASLETIPHNTSGTIGWDATDAIEILATAAKEMDQRYELFRQEGVRDIGEFQSSIGPLARMLIVLDEYADLTTEDDDRKEIEKLLKRLAQKARAAGIHVIISTQKPVVQVVNTVIKGNLPARLALRVNTGAESRVILDENGAEELVGKGDSILKVGNSKTRLQFAWYDDSAS